MDEERPGRSRADAVNTSVVRGWHRVKKVAPAWGALEAQVSGARRRAGVCQDWLAGPWALAVEDPARTAELRRPEGTHARNSRPIGLEDRGPRRAGAPGSLRSL
jgi:hypothetical protein